MKKLERAMDNIMEHDNVINQNSIENDSGICIISNEDVRLRIAVCDDSPEQAGMLGSDFLKASQELNKAAGVELFTSAASLWEKIEEDNRKNAPIYDIIVMDIKMPDMDGIEFGKRLYRLGISTALILVTAYPEYAVEGYSTHAFQFMVKPVTAEAAKRVLLEIYADKADDRYIEIRSSGYTERINIRDIECITAEEKYTRITSRQGDYLTLTSLGAYEEKLTVYGFYRVHRSALVNLAYYVALEKNTIILKNVKLSVSRRRMTGLREAIKLEMEKKLV